MRGPLRDLHDDGAYGRTVGIGGRGLIEPQRHAGGHHPAGLCRDDRQQQSETRQYNSHFLISPPITPPGDGGRIYTKKIALRRETCSSSGHNHRMFSQSSSCEDMVVRKAGFAEFFVPLILLFSCWGAAHAFVGADVADGALRRYTAVVVTAKGPCSGVTLAQDIVLTAAHCVRDDPAIKVFGHPVSATVLHPLHSATDGGSPDLAILKLATPLPERFTAATIHRRELSKDTVLVAAGYGHSTANDYAAGTAVHMVPLQVSHTHGGWLVLRGTDHGVSGTGPGDSGSPVYAYRGMHSVVALIVAGTESQIWAVSPRSALPLDYGYHTETGRALNAAPPPRPLHAA